MGNVPYHVHQQRLQQQQTYNQQPFQQYQQPQYQQVPQYQQYQQQPQYQGQQFRQPQYQGQGYQQPQPFYAPGYGFQPVNHNQVNVNQVVTGTNGEGEAELYYFNKLKDHMTPKVGNFSCIMHELGYFNEHNHVNLEKYRQAYRDLTTVPQAIKEEFLENIDTCDEVAKCLPSKCFEKYPYGHEYGRSFFFVMCEKKKAMEVCQKKQMVEDYYKYKNLLRGQDIPNELN